MCAPPYHDPLNHLAQIVEHMPAVSDVAGVGRSEPRAPGVLRRAVACNDVHPWMRAEPLGERAGGTVGQHIYRAPTFKIHQDRAIHRAFAQRKVIHAQHAWCCPRWQRGMAHKA